jgi:hypothetical protein
MTTHFLSTIHGSGGARGPATNMAVSYGTSTVAAAALNVEINTTIAPAISYDDAIDAILSILNYVRTDKNLPPASRVLNLKLP